MYEGISIKLAEQGYYETLESFGLLEKEARVAGAANRAAGAARRVVRRTVKKPSNRPDWSKGKSRADGAATKQTGRRVEEAAKDVPNKVRKPYVAETPGWGKRMKDWASRNKKPLAIGGGAALAAGAGAGAYAATRDDDDDSK